MIKNVPDSELTGSGLNQRMGKWDFPEHLLVSAAPISIVTA